MQRVSHYPHPSPHRGHGHSQVQPGQDAQVGREGDHGEDGDHREGHLQDKEREGAGGRAEEEGEKGGGDLLRGLPQSRQQTSI